MLIVRTGTYVQSMIRGYLEADGHFKNEIQSMAEQVQVKVEKIDTKTLERKDGTGTFEITEITGGGKVYNGFTNKLGDLPAEGSTVQIRFQPVKSGTTVRNSILSLSTIVDGTELVSPPGKLTYQHQITYPRITPVTQHTTMRKQTMSDLTFFKIQGTTSFAHVKEPDTKGKYPTNKYKMDLLIDDKTATKLSSLGVLVKPPKENVPGKFVTLKSNFQPVVLDNEGNQLSEIPLIGNGSKVTVTVKLYDNKAPNGGKKCLGMNKLEINELVTFSAPNLLDVDN